jgi:hypothetical protein
MKTEHSKLMDKVVQNLDWDSILAVHKVFKMGVGEGNEIIPGLKRKPYSDSLSKTDLKNETVSPFGESLLHAAAFAGNLAVVSLLIKHDANVNIKGSSSSRWTTTCA